MNDLAPTIVYACWAIFVVFWAVTALFVKRTIQRGGWGWERLLLFAVGAFAWMLYRDSSDLARTRLWSASASMAAAAVVITVLGLGITLWARVTLGRNWSGAVVLKEQHELIVRGPYRYVRHPIYSGLLLMSLGTATLRAYSAGFALCVAMLAGFWFKLRAEEGLLTRHFPEAYPQYRECVRALIPFVL